MEMSVIQKAELRKQIREQQKRLSSEEREELNRRLFEKMICHPKFLDAGCIYAYASLPAEPGTWDILNTVLKTGKRLALPRVSGNDMTFYYVSSLDDLEEGVFHIKEPAADCAPAKEKDSLLLVPGMAFSKTGERLGKGGGYYDRFLYGEPDHWTIGLAYEFQIIKNMKTESHDQRIREILTPDADYFTGIL